MQKIMGREGQEIEDRLGLGAGGHRRRWWWMLVAVLALAAVGLWWVRLSDGSGAGPAYVTAPVARGDLTVTVRATGTVEPTTVVEVSSELSGTISEVLVDFNDSVKAGQVLARLDVSALQAQVAVRRASLRAAEASQAKSEATLSEAQTSHDTAQRLDERGVGSRLEATGAAATLARARADVEVAIANVELARANLEVAETELAKACICSPIDGVVLDREADAGQIVAASLQAPTLFVIAGDLTSMELQVAVDEADIGRLSVGNRASFTVDAYDERSFPATIAKIRYAPETVDGVVTYLATLQVDNAGLLLRPGMTATAEIVVREVADALMVPNAALRFRPRQTTTESGGGGGLLGLLMPRRPAETPVQRSANAVWVLRDGVAQEVTVELGETDGALTQILGGDLLEGDPVIIRQAEAS